MQLTSSRWLERSGSSLIAPLSTASTQLENQPSGFVEPPYLLFQEVIPNVMGFAILLSSLILLVCSARHRWKSLNAVVSSPRSLDCQEKQSAAPSPCRQCYYFSANRYLPCAVNPMWAMRPESLSCSDFQPRP